MKNTQLLGLQDVAALLKTEYYRVVYAINSGRVPDVRLRIGNRRLFQPDEVKHLAEFFGVNLIEKEAHAK